MEIKTQSPTRIDLAGGTLDCWPINAILSPVTTINAAINIYTYCRLEPRNDQKIILVSEDWNKSFEFSNSEELFSSNEKEVGFYKEHIRFWGPKEGFKLTTRSESPIGGGLGGSSSLSISIYKAFCQWIGRKPEIYQAVRDCSGIEAKILKTPTGSQDYIPAFQSGINIIDYTVGEPHIQRLESTEFPFAENISVFYTGKSHHSGINNWQVLKKFVDGDPVTDKALKILKEVAEQTKQALLKKDWGELVSLFRQEFEARVLLAESFSSPEIEELSKVGEGAGALATKICGAGGGGCVFLWSEPDKKHQVVRACQKAGFKHLDVDFL